MLLAVTSFILADVSASPAEDLKSIEYPTTPEQNLQFALEYYEKILNRQDFTDLDKYLAEKYINHSPTAEDGKEGVLKLKALLEGSPIGSLEVVHSSVTDDMVWFHSKYVLNGKPAKLLGMFRVACGKLVEHWDAVQEMVPTANDHAYF